MVDRPRGPRKRPSAGSRTPTSRPRTVAGRGRETGELAEPGAATEPTDDLEIVDATDEVTDVEHGSAEPVDPVESATPASDMDGDDAELSPVSDDGAESAATPIDRTAPVDLEGRSSFSRGVAVLVAAVVVLIGIGVAELVYLTRGDSDPQPPSVDAPVQVSELTTRSVVEQAARAAQTILAADYETYDEGIDAATELMTEPYAEEFRTTKLDIKDDFVAAQTKVVVDISAQGVVQASANEIEVMTFLTLTTTKGNEGVTVAQYRVTVTMLKAENTWLVSDLQAL